MEIKPHAMYVETVKLCENKWKMKHNMWGVYKPCDYSREVHSSLVVPLREPLKFLCRTLQQVFAFQKEFQ